MQYFFMKMSPNTPEFLATGQMEVYDSSGAAQFELPMDLAATTNYFRWEADVSKIWPLPAETKTMAQLARIDKTVFLVSMEQKKVYMIYPDLQAYEQIPIPASALAQFDLRSGLIDLKKTEVGPEIVDGHPCIKNRITDIEAGNAPQPGLVWNASDLQGFPIKMELKTDQGIMMFHFHNVVIRQPDPSLFEIPGNYMSFTNTGDLMKYAKSQSRL